jgi:CDP-diacylglycerol--serine O-phosphatidyltransferase
MKGRAGNDRAFGGQLNVLIDIVSDGVAPAVLLLSYVLRYGKFKPAFLVEAFLMLAASAMGLSFSSTFGLDGGTKYTGLGKL